MLVAGCEIPRTEIVARVDSEVPWGTGQALQSVAISVRRVGPNGPLRSARTTALGTERGRLSLPLSVGLIAADDEVDDPVWIEVLGCPGPNGCAPETASVAQRAVVRFTRGRTEELSLLLASACVGVPCRSDERCSVVSGQCEPATRAQDEVRPLGASDAAAPSDRAVASDAVASDGPVTDRGATVDQALPADVAVDAGARDVAPADTGAPDVGARDVPTTDLGAMDAGVRDVPATDVGSPDAGTRDAPPADAGSPDVGARDVPPSDTGPACVAPRTACGGSCVDTSNDLSNCGACNSVCGAAVSGGWCAAGRCYAGARYAVTQPAAAAIRYVDACAAPGSMRVLQMADDEAVSTPLPFETRWWGAALAAGTPMAVAVNGAVHVGGSSGLFSIYQAIPNPSAPNGVIAPHWADLFNTASGTCVATVGTAPSRLWVVEWVRTAIRGVSSSLDFEVIVHEGSGVIEFAYGVLTGSGAAVGLENPTGTEAANGCVGGSIPCSVSSNTRLRFTPSE